LEVGNLVCMSRSALHLAQTWPLVWIQVWAILLLLSCQSDMTVQGPPVSVQFRDVAETTGLRFDHFNGFSGEYYYVETFGSGAAFFDYDSDGYLDIYFVNGAALADTTPEPRPRNQLFRSESARSFQDVTTFSGTGHPGYGMGCAAADIDGDGDRDLFVTNFGPDVLLSNDGDGHFSDLTAALGVGDARWSTGSGFLDYDNDGDLDLFVVHYVEFTLEGNVLCRQGRIRSYCNPDSYAPVADALYRNDAGRFKDVTREAGITGLGRGLGLILADLDWDGDTDIYVANDGDKNHLYENNDGSFTERSLELGVSFNDDGRAEAGMGVDLGDVNGDGLQDLIVTNFSLETHTLYARGKSGEYEDATERLGLSGPTFTPLGFGTLLLDYDNDRDLDLFVANGHVMDVVAQVHAGQTYRQPNQMLMNSAGGQFQDVSHQLGPGLEPILASRAAAVADYDNDGDLDILVTNVAAPPTLLRNDGGNRNHWLMLSLVARHHPDALGTRVTLTAAGTNPQLRQRRSASSYLSTHDPRLHFGLGDATQADLKIQWPDGTIQTLTDIPADQILRVVQPSD